MLIVSTFEIQELMRFQDSVHVQHPYKNASLTPYIIEAKGWLPGMDSNHDSRLQRPLSYH